MIFDINFVPKYFFAYDVLMVPGELKSLAPEAKFHSLATLANHELHFPFCGNSGGAANIRPLNSGEVLGVLWLIRSQKELELRVGHPDLFMRKGVTVLTPRGEAVEAFTYSLPMSRQRGESRPSGEYLAQLGGACEIGIPEDYLKNLELH